MPISVEEGMTMGAHEQSASRQFPRWVGHFQMVSWCLLMRRLSWTLSRTFSCLDIRMVGGIWQGKPRRVVGTLAHWWPLGWVSHINPDYGHLLVRPKPQTIIKQSIWGIEGLPLTILCSHSFPLCVLFGQCSYIPPCKRENQKNSESVMNWQQYWKDEIGSQPFTCYFNQHQR